MADVIKLLNEKKEKYMAETKYQLTAATVRKAIR